MRRAVAVKPFGINRALLVGVVHDVQFGYLSESPCVQFQVSTSNLDPSVICNRRDGSDVVVEGSYLDQRSLEDTMARNWARMKDFTFRETYPVRCVGPEEELQRLKQQLSEGFVVEVVGALKMNKVAAGTDAPQGERGSSRCYPYVKVDVTKGSKVTVLHGSARRALLDNITKSISSPPTAAATQPTVVPMESNMK